MQHGPSTIVDGPYQFFEKNLLVADISLICSVPLNQLVSSHVFEVALGYSQTGIPYMTMTITINGTHQAALAHGEQRTNISVISDVLLMYHRAQEKIGSDSEFIKKYEQREDTDTSDHYIDLDDGDPEGR